ncbi:hypothetical protein VLK31_30455 [Variovorax sp. H27-G14]|uniref:hypothetical protein n=1 Tax=Variovorax sp. H27-G14 TaxID=3111914 RepID=UPI0038FC9E31
MDANLNLPWLVDGVIAFTVVEGIALVVHHRLTGNGPRPGAYLLNMVSGLCLMAALRCAVHDTGALWVAAWLLAAGIAHGADISKRFASAAAAHPRP